MKKIEIELTDEEFAFIESAATLAKIPTEEYAKTVLTQYIQMVAQAMIVKPNKAMLKQALKYAV